ncbi:MAG: hypothetical protein IPP04_17225 [Saprospiraceae bacterium]|nr:hypothetical protein [Saprospiraceae bacterium]
MHAVNITAYTDDKSQIEALLAVIKAFKIKYSISSRDDDKSPYAPDFVAMIKQGEMDLMQGKGVKMTLDELEKLCK